MKTLEALYVRIRRWLWPVRNFLQHLIWSIRCRIHNSNYAGVQPIWVIGFARSGTTWLAESLNFDQKYREIFEPYHPTQNRQVRGRPFYTHIGPNYSLESGISRNIFKFQSNCFEGNVYNINSDLERSRFKFDGVLIKDIFTLMWAEWFRQKHQSLKVVYILRNPFSVALSVNKAKDSDWLLDPIELLNDKSLASNFLQGHESFIRSHVARGDFVVNQILIWAIVTAVSLHELDHSKVHFVFYEDMFINYKAVVSRAVAFTRAYDSIDQVNIEDLNQNKHSKTVGLGSTLLEGKSPLTSWKADLSQEQIDLGWQIMQRFELNQIYSKDGSYCPKALSSYAFPRT